MYRKCKATVYRTLTFIVIQVNTPYNSVLWKLTKSRCGRGQLCFFRWPCLFFARFYILRPLRRFPIFSSPFLSTSLFLFLPILYFSSLRLTSSALSFLFSFFFPISLPLSLFLYFSLLYFISSALSILFLFCSLVSLSYIF